MLPFPIFLRSHYASEKHGLKDNSQKLQQVSDVMAAADANDVGYRAFYISVNFFIHEWRMTGHNKKVTRKRCNSAKLLHTFNHSSCFMGDY